MKTHIEFTRSEMVVPVQKNSSREIGARLEFFGIVRELEGGKKIPGLFYEAHEPMARISLEKIFHELAAKHPCEEIYFIHRLEFVPVGEASLFIRILSQHRQSSLALMTALIDRLKADVPIWKLAAKDSVEIERTLG